MKTIHGWLRFVAGTLFWLNASILFRPALAPLVDRLASKLHVEFTSISIILCLLSLSLLSLYGAKNTVLSALYIYTFPFIFLWKISRWLFKLTSLLHKGIRSTMSGHSEDVPFSEFLPLWQMIIPRTANQPQTAPATAAITASEDKTKAPTDPFLLCLKLSGIVLGRSTLLCGFLIVASGVKAVIIAGLVMTSLSILRVNVFLLAIAFSVKTVTTYITDNFVQWLDNVTVAAQNPPTTSTPPQVPVRSLLVWKFLLSIVAKAREVPEFLAVGGLIAYAATYLWIAVVFYCIYLGVAKLTLHPAYWPEWLDSLAFPILGGGIAHNAILKMIVVLHWGELALLTFVLWKVVGSELFQFRKSLLKFESAIDERIAKLQAELTAKAAPINEQEAAAPSANEVPPPKPKRRAKTARPH